MPLLVRLLVLVDAADAALLQAVALRAKHVLGLAAAAVEEAQADVGAHVGPETIFTQTNIFPGASKASYHARPFPEQYPY